MDRIQPRSALRPGIKAISLGEHVLHGTDNSDPCREFTCIITKCQTVVIDSEPGWVSDETGTPIPFIAIKVPDTDGILQSIGIELDLLLIAANDN